MPYIAYYEDADKVEAAAKARGFTGNDGESWHDFVEAESNRFRTSRQFATLKPAEAWLAAEIRQCKSVYGAGTIAKQQTITDRCRACTCHGVQTVYEYTVTDQGVEDECHVESLCLDD